MAADPIAASNSLANPPATSANRTDAPTAREFIHDEASVVEPAVLFSKFSLWFDQQRALTDVSLPLPKARITTLIGEAGSGKSTLLRSVNRLNRLIAPCHVAGELRLGDQSVYAPDTDETVIRRRVGMVFPSPNCFPMSIFENVVYPLRVAGIRDRLLLETRCEYALRAVGLWSRVHESLRRKAAWLSRGDQQLLCLARAIANEPEVLLMDEPSSTLDPIGASRLEDAVQELAGRLTIVMVTHSMHQAARTSDFTAYLKEGRLIEMGPTLSIFTNPKVEETHDFVTRRHT